MADPQGVARRVLALESQPLAVLAVMGSQEVTPQTPLMEVRRLYMRLAALIHPDKLKGFSKATEAFQVAVKAFDDFASGKLKAASGRSASRPPAKKGTADRPTVPAKPTRKARQAKADSSGSESDSDDVADAPKLESFAPTGPRSNEGCHLTPMSCPSCSTLWQPDTPVLYTLVMAFNIKVHCEVCFLTYGWATGQHFCPLCKKHTSYSPQEYNSKVRCEHCTKPFGYRYTPVTERIRSEIAAKQAEAAKEAASRKEREQRMSRRGGGSDDDIDLKVGECIVEDRCPLCRKTVKRKHKDHVLACIAAGVVPPAPRRVVIEGERATRGSGRAAAKPQPKRSTTAKKQAAKRPVASKSAGKANSRATVSAKRQRSTRRQLCSDSDDSTSSSSDWGDDTSTD